MAEEGLSTSAYDETWGKSARFTVRCVRNLGMDASSEDEAKANLQNINYVPEDMIIVSGPGLDGNTAEINTNSVYEFDMTNMNPQSIRYYSSQELEPLNEHSVEARVYWAFETGPMTDQTYLYSSLFDLIREGKSPCPAGYRTPNVREGALMSLRCPEGWQGSVYTRVSTCYSHGLRGTDQDPGAKKGKSDSWFFNGYKIYLDYSERTPVRCVKDIRK